MTYNILLEIDSMNRMCHGALDNMYNPIRKKKEREREGKTNLDVKQHYKPFVQFLSCRNAFVVQIMKPERMFSLFLCTWKTLKKQKDDFPTTTGLLSVRFN